MLEKVETTKEAAIYQGCGFSFKPKTPRIRRLQRT